MFFVPDFHYCIPSKNNLERLYGLDLTGSSKVENIVDVAAEADEGFPAYDQNMPYAYDANGNMIYDPSRKVHISYNRLNLPDTLTFENERMITNRYDQEGQKLTQTIWMDYLEPTIVETGSDPHTGEQDTILSSGTFIAENRNYVENIELVNEKIQVVHHAEGRVVDTEGVGVAILPDTIDLNFDDDQYYYGSSLVVPSIVLGTGELVIEAHDSIWLVGPHEVVEASGVDYCVQIAEFEQDTGWQWEYYIRDHLGNLRLTFSDLNDDGAVNVSLDSLNEILEEHHYYPFGMKHNGPWLKRKDRGFENKYNYNGKEEMPFTGYLYYGFRCYDPSTARFTSIDPISDQFPHVSTFNYAENSPIRNIDLHGLQGVDVNAGYNQVMARIHGTEEQAKAYENVQKAQAYGTIGGIGVGAGAIAVAMAGPEATAAFLLNEAKDEVLSQATGGATDILDATKMGAKLLKEGGTRLYRAVSKAELNDIKDSGQIRPGKGTMEVKLFTDNVDDAIKQGDATGGEYSIIQVEVPSSTVDQLETLQVDTRMTTGNTIAVQPDKQELFNTTRGKVSILDE